MKELLKWGRLLGSAASLLAVPVLGLSLGCSSSSKTSGADTAGSGGAATSSAGKGSGPGAGAGSGGSSGAPGGGGTATAGNGTGGGSGGATSGGHGGAGGSGSGGSGGTAGMTTEAAGEGGTSDGNATCAAVDITDSQKQGGTYHGTTTGSSTANATCYTQTGPVAVLYYHADAAENVRIDVTSSKPSTDPSASDAAVWVRNDCSSPYSEFACNATAASASTYAGIDMDYQTLMFSGDVYITVAGTFFDAGFDLTINGLNSCFVDIDCTKYEAARCNQLTSVCHTSLPCPTGTADCDHDETNGCETVIQGSDLNNCGACGGTCTTGAPHQTGVACVTGKCTLSCADGWGDCDGQGYDGCESNLATSSLACGACGKSCEGGLCANSTCGPSDETVTTVALPTSDSVISHIEVDANNVYAENYTNLNQGLWVAPKTSSSTATLVSVEVLYDFTVTKDALLVIDSGALEKRTNDGTLTTLFPLTHGVDPRYVITDGSNIWLLDNGEATEPTSTPAGVYPLPNGSSTTSTPLWTDESGEWVGGVFNGTDLIVRGLGWGGSAYNYPDPTFERVPLSGAPSAFGSLTVIAPFAADADHVYYGGDALYSLPIGGSSATKLWTPAGGGVFSVVTDGTNVYFAECANDYQPARIHRIPKGGGTDVILASDSVAGYAFEGTYCGGDQNLVAYRALALDDTYLYWGSGDGAIRRMPK
ncbi:MAG TPA: hypothetical protein VMI54_15460 [Polyangiaceae bacterium]|nr:hypothetical protein [Polyangiaceae bacterium]